ncbi:DUF1911 domain-containing protein [Hymenobacter weizhouensis]|uniref:DUF1911 domain-containing protein n=1 Tax=Hymenobacter sp. YIM 151500-1 TaxID=2987689 RepID=UPI0022261D70|nr:DUF1911 domain-containing protein [Hymenobacter sp. YIM 151500-1]UYZ64045.1 DUF1911 domain-containing protein [Hymenobacter sp. YIM 151500-1]
MDKREPLLTESFFEQTVSFTQSSIERFAAPLRDQYETIAKPEVFLFAVFNKRYALLSLKYSRGYPVQDLVPDLLAAIDALAAYKQHPQAEDFFFNGEQDEYMQAVALLSLGLLLRVDTDVFKRLVEAIGLNGQDYLLEWLAGRRLPHRPPTVQLLFPKTYARLRDAIQAPRDLTPPFLKAFLAHWYESLDTVWYNIHAHRTDAAGFTGYWCWEAAAVAFALRVDDTELQTMRYYPKDLADVAFGRSTTPV